MRQIRKSGASPVGPPVGPGWWLFSLLACAGFALRYTWRNAPFLDLERYAAGAERMPYQGRVLMAWILHASAGNPQFADELNRLASHLPLDMRSPYLLVILLVNLIAIFAALLAARFSLEHLTGDKTFAAWASLLFLYMSYFNLVVGYGMFMLPYDIPSLSIFMMSVWAILTRRYWVVALLVALGALNRETSLFIPVFFVLYTWFSVRSKDSNWKEHFRRWSPNLFHLGMQMVIWLVLRLWIHHLFLHNVPDEGAFANGFMHFRQNLVSLVKPMQWPLLLSLFGFTLPLFIAKFKLIGDRALAISTAVICVLWTCLMLLVGVLIEIRIFSELTAFIMPCVALIVWNKWVKPASAASLR
jgi:hypothetical protein